MRKSIIVGFCALAACAATANAVPKSVSLSNSKLAVAMSDGTTCEADWNVAAGVTSGTLGGCPHALRYDIVPTENRNFLRRGFEQVYSAIGVLDQAVGFAAVEITDVAGEIYRFNSPK